MNTIEKVKKNRIPKTKISVLNIIKARFSPRIFSPKNVPFQDLKIILEAARLTPSARNYQPWFFYVSKIKSQSYQKIMACLEEKNFLWAKTSPIIIVACYDPTDTIDKTNKWAVYDLGASVMSLVYQAHDLGYYCRQIGIFDSDKIKQELSIPNPLIPFTLVALGKIGDEKDYQHADPEIIKKELTPNTKKAKIFEILK
jgi:nitroreductase